VYDLPGPLCARHVISFPRFSFPISHFPVPSFISTPPPSIFAYCKRSNTGGGNGLGMRLHCSEGAQAYRGSYSSVTYSCNIRNEIGVMRFLCNEIAMSDGFEKQNLAPTVPKTLHSNDLSLEICMLLVVKSLHSSRDCWPCSRLCVRTL